MKKLAIVGKHPATMHDAPYDDESYDIWAFNNSGSKFKRVTTLFEMHQILPGHNVDDYENRLEWLRNNTIIPVYMREYRDDIPMCTVYPFEEVFAITKHILFEEEELRYFTSSVPMAIALAVLQERPSIDFYGIELNTAIEHSKQRDCFTFWTGFAGGRGIRININCADTIFTKEIYGS